jgi:hypothetical protein
MICIIPIFSELPFITVEVFHDHGFMNCVGIELGTSVIMLITSDIEDPLNTSSAR